MAAAMVCGRKSNNLVLDNKQNRIRMKFFYLLTLVLVCCITNAQTPRILRDCDSLTCVEYIRVNDTIFISNTLNPTTNKILKSEIYLHYGVDGHFISDIIFYYDSNENIKQKKTVIGTDIEDVFYGNGGMNRVYTSIFKFEEFAPNGNLLKMGTLIGDIKDGEWFYYMDNRLISVELYKRGDLIKQVKIKGE
jgi:hypothetical protein